MKTPFPILKLSANGNTFALLDLRLAAFGRARKVSLPVLARKFSSELASDGLVVIRKEKSKSLRGHAIRIAFFNPDGSEAFCGNGTRAAGFYQVHYAARKSSGEVTIDTCDGHRRVTVKGAAVSMRGVPVPQVGGKLTVDLGAQGSWEVHRVHAGCPHAVIFVKDIQKIDVEEVGRLIRKSRFFVPEGTNVDFVSSSAQVRTYERGVERETKSCGSGALAVAALLRHLGRVKGDLCRIQTQGGELRVRFDANGSGWALEGTVEVLFDGNAWVS